VEWGWTEKQCLDYCYSLGYDWGGLYELFNRVSCWCCPLQPLEELRKLRLHFPELWKELIEMDRRTWRKFRSDYSVEELEKRFTFEEQRTAEGKSIRNREFFNELKGLLGNGGNT
jgi:3'-phosphoadenosine 5'-phosphosulfate sulfotransferase (PAPS reductase)/FAD synthetase